MCSQAYNSLLSCAECLAPPLILEASANGIAHGQPLQFLGFPFGWRWQTKVIAGHKFPTPFVKAGILSGATDDFSHLIIDGYGNKGFSGGPVVFQPEGPFSHKLRVAGVVSRLPVTPLNPIVNKKNCIITNEDNAPLGYVQENPGFIEAVTINQVIDMIDANPIGFPLADEHPSPHNQ